MGFTSAFKKLNSILPCTLEISFRLFPFCISFHKATFCYRLRCITSSLFSSNWRNTLPSISLGVRPQKATNAVMTLRVLWNSGHFLAIWGLICGSSWRSRYSDWVRARRSGDRIPMGRDFPHLSIPASCTTGTGSFPEVKSGRGVTLTRHPLLVSWSWKSKAIPLLPLRAVRPVQSLSSCTRVHFTFIFWGLTCFSRMTLPHGVN
jgi:hypothetical protein